ncbi:MAG TPA: hypothetical protein VI912_04600 [Candidatus Bilamarchaeaceae archaeon]|nr:hypothetical protein [Candidatus Bilamarchaeaceae archaeon]
MNLLIVFHAIAGAFGFMTFMWIAIELLILSRINKQSIDRIQILSVLGLVALLGSWIMGGYYYVTVYGPNVKPLVKEEAEWVHSIGMEVKEHLFLFLPFLAFLEVFLIKNYSNRIEEVRRTLLIIAVTIVLFGFMMEFVGALISNAARAALEAKV